jgi:hypothetical protein
VLDLSDAPVAVTDAALGYTPQHGTKLCPQFPNLLSYSMARARGLSQLNPLAIHLAVPSLEELDLSDCPALLDNTLALTLRRCPHLRVLVACRCLGLDGSFASAALEPPAARRLERLALAGCTGIADSAVQTLLQAGAPIRELDARQCAEVGPLTASALATAGIVEVVKVEGAGPPPAASRLVASKCPLRELDVAAITIWKKATITACSMAADDDSISQLREPSGAAGMVSLALSGARAGEVALPETLTVLGLSR